MLEFNAVYALEPDEANFARLTALSETIPKLYCVKKGAWNKADILKFDSEGTVNSCVSDNGNTIIEVDTIDNILNGRRVSFIKMDIEGAELNALKGAEQSIRNYKPKLAVCAYHKANDLITIPQYIKSIVPEYKLYFRLHQYGPVEAVLYAV